MNEETATISLKRLRALESLEKLINDGSKFFKYGYDSHYVELSQTDIIRHGQDHERLKQENQRMYNKVHELERELENLRIKKRSIF